MQQDCLHHLTNCKIIKQEKYFISLFNFAVNQRTDIHETLVWKSDLSEKNKMEIFQAVAMLVLLCGYITWTSTNAWRKRKMRSTQGCCMLSLINFWISTLHESSCTATYLSLHKSSKQDMLSTAGDIRMNS